MRFIYPLLFILLLPAIASSQLTADFNLDRTGGCSPLRVSFTAVSNGASTNAVFTWDLGNGNQSALRNPAAIYTEEKTYTVRLTITDGNQTATRSKTLTVYKKPVVDFSAANAKVCLPANAQFTATPLAGDGTISSYQWDFGDGITQAGYGSTMSHYYSVEQVATVGLTVTNSYGCQASVVKPNIVEILPAINPSISSDKALLCLLTESVQFTNNSTGPGTLQYRWDFGDGTTSALVQPTHRFTTKGVYPVKLTVSNEVGCSATSTPVSINAAYFNINFTPRPLCREVSFTPGSYLYPIGTQWQFGDGAVSSLPGTVSHTYATPGKYTVTLIQTYSGGCKDTVAQAVTVQEIVNFGSDISMPAAACESSTVSFSSKSNTKPSQIQWDFGDGGRLNTPYPDVNYTYMKPGTYTVKMTNVFGTCSETITKNIVVNALPTPQGFEVNYGGICGAPVTVSFTDTTPGAVAWKWYMNYAYNTPFSTAQKSSYQFTYDGYYSVYLTVTNAAGCSRSVSKSVNVFRPSANIYLSTSSSPRGNYDCDSLRIRLAVNSNQTIKSYNWNLGNGNTSTSATPDAFYDKAGVYNISLNYVTESGCTASTSYAVRVYDKPKADFVYTIPCGNSLDLQFRDISFFSDSWRWSYGDQTVDYYSASPVHHYQDTGKYTVQFINSIGRCSDTIVKTVYANVLPSSVTITKAANTCDGDRGTITFDQRSVRATGMLWDFGDGSTQSYDTSAHTVTHTYKATGTYNVRLTGQYNGCVLSSSTTVRVLLKQNPVLTADKTEICASDNLRIQISGLVTNPFAYSYQYGQYSINKLEYNTGAAYTGNINDYYNWNFTTYATTLSNFTAGVTKMRAIINSGQPGCTDTTNYINLQVNGPIAGFKVQNSSQCFKSPFVFTDTSRAVTATQLSQWYWDFGDGTTKNNSTNSPVTHTYANPGRYTVRLRVTDASGCNASFTTEVDARGTKAGFTASGLYFPNIPLNTTVNFYNTSNNNSANPVYTWWYGDGATTTGYSGQHTYTSAATNTIRLVASDASIPCSDTVEKVVTVKDFNTAFSFTTSYMGSSNCLPVLVRINNLSVGYTRLKWDFGDGTTTTSTTYPSHIYQKPGIYKITLYTYGYNGLSGTYVDSVQIKEPSAQIGADALQGCQPQSVHLQATTQNTSSYLWDFGNGVVSNGAATQTVNYNVAGMFTPRLIVQDANGCPTAATLPQPIVIDSLTVKITDLPALLCDSALIPFGTQVSSFAAARLGTPLQYYWNFGTGQPADTAQVPNPVFRFSQPGTYLVKLRVTSPFGCSQETAATLVVNEKARGRITAVPEICENGTVQFSGAANPGGNLQWAWAFGNGNTSLQQNPPAQVYNQPGNYPIRLLVTRNGCVDTVLHHLTVHPKPLISATPQQAVVCLGNAVTLSASGGTRYQWTPAAGLSDAAVATPVASPRATTLYRVQATTDKGCVNTDSVLLTVGQPVSVKLAAALDLCQGSSLQLNASGAASYRWVENVAGLSNTAVANPVAHPPATAVYTVVGTDQHRCFTDTARVTVTVHNLPAVNAGPDLQLPGNVPYPLVASSSSDVTSWLWSPAADLSCTNCAAPILTPKMEQRYVVQVSNQWGCTAADTLLVKLDCATNHVYFPTAITPNGDGKNDVFYALGSGVKQVRYLRIYSRWGDLIVERNNIAINDRAAGWDGYLKGRPVETGTYVYVAELECSSGALFTRQGTFTIIR